MNRKIAIRFSILLFVLLGMFLGYRSLLDYFRERKYESGVDTAGLIAALEETQQGTKAVVFSPSGEKTSPPGTDDSTIDRDVSWSVDGNTLFLASNRATETSKGEKGAFNIFGWRYKDARVETYTNQQRSQSAPRFSVIGGTAEGLVLSGGNVMGFDPLKKTGEQIMPPSIRYHGSQGEEGGQSTMDSLYSRLGNSFKEASWIPDQVGMYAVMRRDDGEVFMMHDFRPDTNGQMKPPVGLLAGSRIQFSEGPDGNFIVCQSDATVVDSEAPPENWVKDGKLFPNIGGTKLTHMIWFGTWNGTQPKLTPMVPPQPSGDASQPVFMDPVVSPDGTKFLLVIAVRKSETETVPTGLIMGDMKEDGVIGAKRVIEGPISEPSWSPDGKNIVFVVNDGEHRSIYVIAADGSGRRKVSSDGNFSSPVFSPQKQKLSQ